MNTISIVVYDNNLNGKSVKLFSVESNNKTSLESMIAGMILALEIKIDINPMLISKHISVSKGRHHTIVEMIDYISHPEDFSPFSMKEQEEYNSITQETKTIVGSD